MTDYIKFDNIKNIIQPLDLIAFRGADFVSDFISIVQNLELGSGEFSHVGIIINKDIMPFIPQLEDNKLYVWESTMSANIPGIYGEDNTPDILSNKGRLGVQIRDFQDVLKTYTASEGAKVAYCKLKNNPWIIDSAKSKIIKIIEDIHIQYGRKLYDLSPCELLAALFKCLRPVRDMFHEQIVKDIKIITNIDLNLNDDTWLFCSELVAYIYSQLNILPKNIKPNTVTPMDLLGYDTDAKYNIVETPIYLTP